MDHLPLLISYLRFQRTGWSPGTVLAKYEYVALESLQPGMLLEVFGLFKFYPKSEDASLIVGSLGLLPCS